MSASHKISVSLRLRKSFLRSEINQPGPKKKSDTPCQLIGQWITPYNGHTSVGGHFLPACLALITLYLAGPQQLLCARAAPRWFITRDFSNSASTRTRLLHALFCFWLDALIAAPRMIRGFNRRGSRRRRVEVCCFLKREWSECLFEINCVARG